MNAIGTIAPSETAASRLKTVPFWAPEREPYKRDLRKAWYHFFEFKKDKEDTSEVFRFFDHLPWVDVDKTVAAFLSTDEGKRVFETEPFLPDILDDHETLRRDYPEGSLAHAYCDYMETDGLSAAGLVAEFEEFRLEGGRPDEQIEWYIDRLRDTHDLLHLLSGIGRDTLGEATLGAYVFGQRPSHGHLILGVAGSLVMKTSVTTKAPVLRAIWDAKAAGKNCVPIAEQSIRDLLALTPDKARAKLNMKPARVYEECLAVWAKEGIDPLAILAKEDPSAGTRPGKSESVKGEGTKGQAQQA